MLEVAALLGYIAGLTGIIAACFTVVVLDQARKRRKRVSAEAQHAKGCQHILVEFTPSTGQTRCRTCGELISQDMPRD